MTVSPAALLAGKKVMITGGLGMIGSALARKLVAAGARVTLMDPCIGPYGASLLNIHDIRDTGEVRNAAGWQPAIGLAEGIRATCDDYVRHRAHYW